MQLRKTNPNVVVVDDFFTTPDDVRAFGLSREFRASSDYFQGQRSTTRHLWPGLKEEFERLLNRKITRWEEHDVNGVFQFCAAGEKIVYHSDAQTYAGVIYLSPDAPPQSGTTLVRSKTTKGRTLEESLRLGNLGEEHAFNVEKEMYAGKLLDGTAWEQVDVLGNVYNRLVLWNAKFAHHASCYFGHSKETARFFQIFFLDAE